MLTIYESHSRKLLFSGDVESALAAGIRLHRSTREVTLEGRRRQVVNQATEPGCLSLWVAS